MRKRVRFQLGIDEEKQSTSLVGVDLEIMKGIAESGIMERGQPSLMGLYLPRQELVRCTNLPKTSSEYIQAKTFTSCGLSRIRLEENEVWRPIDYDISTRRNAIFWKTHSDAENGKTIHRPPTVNDLKEAVVAARNGYDTTLFVLTSKGVWILVSKHLDFESNKVIHEFDLEIQEYSKYTEFIQTRTHVEEKRMKHLSVQFVSFH